MFFLSPLNVRSCTVIKSGYLLPQSLDADKALNKLLSNKHSLSKVVFLMFLFKVLMFLVSLQ